VEVGTTRDCRREREVWRGVQLKIEYLRGAPGVRGYFTILDAVTTLAIELVIHEKFPDKIQQDFG
jgi:hypothetical protein